MSWLVAVLGLAFLVLIHEAGHFFAARSLGMRTIWMQRWLGGGGATLPHRDKRPLATGKNQRRRGHKPAYVCARIGSLRKLAPAQ